MMLNFKLCDMKRIFLIALTGLMLTSCYNEPQSTKKQGNFDVSFLFEQDGVKVYRFRDGSRYHYFTTLGETMTTYTSGKNNRHDENIK